MESDSDGRVCVAPERIAELTPVAERVEIADDEPFVVEILPAAKIDKPNNPHLARKVLLRDGARCANPGCGSRKRLHSHHIEFRARGGRTVLGNLTAICEVCHKLVHLGRLQVTGSPTAGLTWTRVPMDPTTRLRDVAAIEARLAEIAQTFEELANTTAPARTKSERVDTATGPQRQEAIREKSEGVDTAAACPGERRAPEPPPAPHRESECVDTPAGAPEPGPSRGESEGVAGHSTISRRAVSGRN
jgi:hypothetical protein